MVDYRGDTIFLTRGDAAVINLSVYRNEEEQYSIKDTDVIQFFLLDKPSKKPDTKVYLKKTFSKPASGDTAKTVTITLDSSDTLYLGKEEYYYVVILTQTTGQKCVDTICRGSFYLQL